MGWPFGFRVQGLRTRVQGSGFRFQALGISALLFFGLGIRVSGDCGLGCRVHGLGISCPLTFVRGLGVGV